MSYLFGRYITKDGLKAIEKHQYRPGAYSAIDNMLNPFWVTVVELLPMKMAPNAVTLLGLICLAGSYSTMLYYDMTMTQYLPRWTYLAVALGIFLFQTLDAIDGKQARRTNSSSPLGQLFDHGCDAVSWTITNMSVCSFLNLGLSFNTALTIFASCGPYYITNLLEYYSGVYEYSVGILDATSGQMMLIFFNLVPFIFGPEVYDLKAKDAFPFLPGFISREFILRDYAMVLVVYVGCIYSFILVFNVFKSVKDLKTRLIVALQVIQHLACYVLLYNFDNSIPFIRNNAGLVCICILFLYCIITSKLIVCYMAKMRYSFVHLEYLIFGVYFYFQSKYDGSIESEQNLKLAFWGVFATVFLLYFRFVQGCISQITNHLGIYCFTIGQQKSKEQ